MRSFLFVAAVAFLLPTGAFAVEPPALSNWPSDDWYPSIDQCAEFAAAAQQMNGTRARMCTVLHGSATGRWSGKSKEYQAFCRSHTAGQCKAELQAMANTINTCSKPRVRRSVNPKILSQKNSSQKNQGAGAIIGPGLLEGGGGFSSQGPAATGAPSMAPVRGGHAGSHL